MLHSAFNSNRCHGCIDGMRLGHTNELMSCRIITWKGRCILELRLRDLHIESRFKRPWRQVAPKRDLGNGSQAVDWSRATFKMVTTFKTNRLWKIACAIHRTAKERLEARSKRTMLDRIAALDQGVAHHDGIPRLRTHRGRNGQRKQREQKEPFPYHDSR